MLRQIRGSLIYGNEISRRSCVKKAGGRKAAQPERGMAQRAFAETERTATASLASVAPIVPVRNVATSVRFYTQDLGFRTAAQNTDMSAALVERDGVRLMLLRAADFDTLRATEKHMSAYVWVDDVDALGREWEPAFSALPAHRFVAPFDREGGGREMHVKDPDGFLLFFVSAPRAPN